MRIAFRHLFGVVAPVNDQPPEPERAEQTPAEAPNGEPIEKAAETPPSTSQE